MISKDALKPLGILRWEELRADYHHADLLLGNGFSVNLYDKFAYHPLFDSFLANCTKEDETIFRKFQTANFESIQQTLSSAKKVNDILGTRNPRIDELLNQLKDGLINVIRENHPRFQDIPQDRLRLIAEQLDFFNDIFTLNYDLYLYHIIMKSVDRHKHDEAVRPYGDYFWGEIDDQFKGFTGYQNYKVYKNVYYLHGALFLFRQANQDLKLKRDSIELIELVGKTIEGGLMPLFVSEGSSDDKLNTISQSRYLLFARDKLKEAENPLVIFGASLSEPDRHIIAALNQHKRKIAMSIFIDDKSEDALKTVIRSLKHQLSSHDVQFFDSSTLFSF
jgi:hypothetical protein